MKYKITVVNVSDEGMAVQLNFQNSDGVLVQGVTDLKNKGNVLVLKTEKRVFEYNLKLVHSIAFVKK
ncbi:hypothetical protein LQZ24_05775 [Fructobacillus sp. M1-13]|uniref:PilZ domain-containing protein n=1 Tax=Fructobacillus papyriferae TaxID=2713171 RepID=A0ABS5QPJ3_9LACO|nr:hypothetical protein [Fructobacillus papyriferae]MBS9335010.1 hypothetical protein [Fructobacillus papyriferae]MCD2159504.1 hypothetical protein [Fructobacillus papyriferae]